MKYRVNRSILSGELGNGVPNVALLRKLGMQADLYLQKILSREEVDTSMSSPINNVIRGVSPIISHWAGGYLVGVYKSGSFAKGTANKSGTDIDLLISLSNSTPNSLGDVYDRLYTYLYN